LFLTTLLQIAEIIIQTLFVGFVTMLTLAGGLSFGLGGKDMVRELLEDVKMAELKEIKKEIKESSCKFRDGEVIAALQDYNKKQNGRLDEIKKQGGNHSTMLTTILAIAEGRKSLWKELGIVILCMGAFGGLVFGVIQLF